jgi:hypothetical protein
MTLESSPTQPRKELDGLSYYALTDGKYDFTKYIKRVNGTILTGYQLRYIYLIDKTCKITVPILPFSKIDELGAGMYKGERVSLQSRKQPAVKAFTDEAPAHQLEKAVDTDLTAQNP